VIARHRQRWVWIAVAAFIAQTILWSFTTHLYARIAVPMLIPLVVLAASSADAVKTRLPRTVYALVLIGGLLFNLINMGGLYVEHLYRGGGGKLPVEGATELFTEGVAAGHHHVKIINEELSKGAKVLVVGDAKAFYFQRPVDYCVVFNRNPFVEAIRHAGTPQDVVDWLRRQGYTHVYVNWIEIQRLHKSAYGFEPEITPECFDRLTQFGLRRSNVFSITTENREISYGEFYGVAP